MSTSRTSQPFPDMCLPSSLTEDEEDKAVGTMGLVPVAAPSVLTRRLQLLHACRRSMAPSRRRKREMTPTEKKDASYWDKRRKNNEAAKRSREKRRLNDLMLEGQLLALSQENTQLRAEVLNLSQYYMGVGRGPAAGHPHHHNAPLRCPTPAHVQPSLWGLSAGLPPADCCQDWCQHWAPPAPCSSGPSSQLFSPLMNSQGYGPVLPCALSLDQLGEASRQVDSAAHQQVSSSNDPDGKQEPRPAQSASSPTEDLGTPSGTNWLLTGTNQPGSQHSKLLVQWGSSCVRPSPLHPYWPPPIPLPVRDAERGNHGIGSFLNFSSKFRMLSAELSQMRRYLRPDSS